MSSRGAPNPAASIEPSILSIRGQRVMLNADLAALYGVSTRVLNAPIAVQASAQVVRAFVRLQEMLETYEDLVFKSPLMLPGNSWYFRNMFYGAQALLLTGDVRRSTHAGVIAAFNQQFIQSGERANVRRHDGRSIAAH